MYVESDPQPGWGKTGNCSRPKVSGIVLDF